MRCYSMLVRAAGESSRQAADSLCALFHGTTILGPMKDWGTMKEHKLGILPLQIFYQWFQVENYLTSQLFWKEDVWCMLWSELSWYCICHSVLSTELKSRVPQSDSAVCIVGEILMSEKRKQKEDWFNWQGVVQLARRLGTLITRVL